MYDFTQQLVAGQKAESFVAKLFAPAYEIAFANKQWQKQGIDYVFTDRVSRAVRTVELKTDWTAARTGNAFIETISVDTAHKPGWAYTSQADWLLYFVPGHSTIYRIDFGDLRLELTGWAAWYPVKQIPNRDYQTHGLLVPLSELERIAADMIDVELTSCADCCHRLIKRGNVDYCLRYKSIIPEGTDFAATCPEFKPVK